MYESESEVAQSCPTLCDPWTVVGQVPLSMGFSRQEYWTWLPFPSPGDLPDSGIKPSLLHYRQTFYHLSHQGIPMCLNAGKVPYVKFKVLSHLTAFLSLQGVLGTVNGTVLAYPISFIGLDSHALLLNLLYKRGYKGLLMCLNAATVLGSHPSLLVLLVGIWDRKVLKCNCGPFC